MTYTPEHLAAALTWIEQHAPDGIRLVARALARTAPEVTPAPPRSIYEGLPEPWPDIHGEGKR